jgi:hypothetical protein
MCGWNSHQPADDRVLAERRAGARTEKLFMMQMVSRLLLAAPIALVVGCFNDRLIETGPDTSCTPANHCIDLGDEVQCEEGYDWASEEPGNFVCVEVVEVDNPFEPPVEPVEPPPEQPPTEQPPQQIQITIRGHAEYEDRAPQVTGLGPVTAEPIRRAVVAVIDANTGAEYGGAETDESGDFVVTATAPEDASLDVTILAYNATEGVGVFDCPDFEGCEPALHAMVRAAPSGTDVDIGTFVASATSVGPAFNALDVALVGIDQAELSFGGDAPLLALLWERGKSLDCKSCFGGIDDPDEYSVIFLSGDPADDDAFDDLVILHELGHFFDFVWSHSDSPGLTHDGSPIDPRVAWGEGLATYLGCRIAGAPVLLDTNPVGAGFYAIDEPDFPADRRDEIDQDLSEFVVSATLWQLDHGVGGFPGAGPEPIDAVLQDFLGDDQARTDRGVDGVDLVDFIDGWRCLDLGAAGTLEEVIDETQRFPYDFNDEVCQ